MSQIQRLLLATCIAAGSLATTSCAFLDKKETVVAINEVPPSVRTAIQNVTAGGTIKSIEKIERRNKVTYEVEYAKDGKQLDAFFAEDGTRVKSAQ
jgi:hypothetical protein